MGKHFDRAEVLFAQDRYELAEKELRAEIAQNPQSANDRALLCVCLINQKKQSDNLNEELELIQYALSLDANNSWYNYVLAIDPNSLASLNLLTNIYVMTGRYEQAIESSQTALSCDPNNAKAQDLHCP